MALQEAEGGPVNQQPTAEIVGRGEEEEESVKQAFHTQTEKLDFQEGDDDGVGPEEDKGENGVDEEVLNGSSGPEVKVEHGQKEREHGGTAFLGGTLKDQVANMSVASASDLPTDVTLNSCVEQEEGERPEPQASGSDLKGEEEEEEGDEASRQSSAPEAEGQGKEEEKKEAEGEKEGEGEQSEQEWMDILGNGQLLKKVIRPGEGPNSRATPQCRVKVRTKGTLEGGGVVDKHSGLTFTLGDGDVIQALDLCVSLMEKGEVACLQTEPRFAYGAQGRDPDVPGNAKITYEIELLEVLEPLDFEKIEQADLIQFVNKKRLRGNDLFVRKEYSLASNSYQKGLSLLQNYLDEQHLEASTEVRDMQIRLWNNLAASLTRGEQYKEALEASENVLKHDPQNVKALYRSGKALANMGNLDLAVKRLTLAVQLNPDEKAIVLELQRATQKRDAAKEQEKRMYRRMMEGGRPSTDSKPTATSRPNQQDSIWGPLPYMAIAAIVAAVGIGVAYFLTQRHTH